MDEWGSVPGFQHDGPSEIRSIFFFLVFIASFLVLSSLTLKRNVPLFLSPLLENKTNTIQFGVNDTLDAMQYIGPGQQKESHIRCVERYH